VSVDYLRQIKPGVATDKLPPASRTALRMLKAGKANPQQQRAAYRIIVYDICGIHQIGMALPGEESTANWRNGVRWPGLYIEAQTLLPAENDPPPAPRKRETMTDKALKRAAENPATT